MCLRKSRSDSQGVSVTPSDTSAKDMSRKAFAGMKEAALMETPKHTKSLFLSTIIWSFPVE